MSDSKFDIIGINQDDLHYLENRKVRKNAEEEANSLDLTSPTFFNKLANGKYTLRVLRVCFAVFMATLAIIVIVVIITRGLHLVIPESYYWLSNSQLSDLDKLITFVAIGITARYLPSGKIKDK